MSFNIAIDGPAGAGKSTVARRAAGKLGFIYVDTGAMYRTIALYMLRGQVNIDDEKELAAALDRISVSLSYQDGVQHMFLNGEDVSSLIRTPEVSATASLTSAKAAVRAKLTDLQKDLAARENVLMDGRDIGTCILPDAQLKIFLTARPRVRAKRRYDELTARGEKADLDQIEQDIIQRDRQDMSRAVSPLRQAEDAVLVDTSDMDIEQVTAKIRSLDRSQKKYWL